LVKIEVTESPSELLTAQEYGEITA
jgi:hypothetical protein